MSNDVDYAVTRLTQRHTIPTEGHDVEWESLLVMLRERIRSSGGDGKSGGSGGDGSVIDVGAFTLYEHIDGEARAWCNDLHVSHAGQVADVVARLWQHTKTEWAGGRLSEESYERISKKITGWVWKIEDMFDPPVRKEILGACPNCGNSSVSNGDLGPISALHAHYRPARTSIVIECRAALPDGSDCGGIWVHLDDIEKLGAHLGVVPDSVELRRLRA